MSSSCHFPKPLSSNAIRAVDTFLSKSETAWNTRTADIFWLSTIFHFFCHLLEWCRAIIKSCRADFSSNRNSSSSPCPHGTPRRINHSSVLIQKILIGKKLAKKWFLFTLNWMVQWPLLPLGMFIFCILTNLLRIRSRMQTCFRHWLCSLQSSICRLAHRGSSLPDSRSSRSTGFRSGLTGFRSGSTRSDFRLSSKRDLFSRLRRFERWDTQLNEQKC